jgi:hypothetical protein
VTRTLPRWATAAELENAPRACAAVWAGLGAAAGGYTFLLSVQQVRVPDDYGAWWVPEPWSGVLWGAGALGLLVWLGLALPLLVLGLSWLRWFARGTRLRSAAWLTAWLCGLALMALIAGVQNVPPVPYTGPAIVSWAELPLAAALLVLGAVMVLIAPRARPSLDTAPAPPGTRRLRG